MIMSSKLKYVFSAFLLGFGVLISPCWGGYLEDFPLVTDERNFKESVGGKGFGPQGRIIEDKTQHYLVNEKFLPTDRDNLWRYVVSLNVKRGDDILGILQKLSTQLLPTANRHRLGFVVGINEKVTAANLPDYQCPLKDFVLLLDQKALEELGVPVLFVYSQWTSFREHRTDKSLSPQKIREAFHDQLSGLNGRQQKSLREGVEKEDKTHQYPFGAMRSYILNYPESIKFVEKMGIENTPVYIQVQDADFTDLQTVPLFYSFDQKERKPETLFKRYDTLIIDHQRRAGILPLLVGGAHVYSPSELLERTTPHSRYWTRFASEIGNFLKDIIGQYQPYGLYFHEPNTLFLSPRSVECLLRDLYPQVYSKFRNFCFGINSEIQDFTRAIFRGLEDNDCRKLMVFSSKTILATSMKRGGDNKNFSIRFGGNYKAQKFSGWKMDDLKAIHGMPQEIVDANSWSNTLCTGFSNHLKADSRSLISSLFNVFDPYALDQSGEDGFFKTLIGFEKKIDKDSIKDIFQELLGRYDKKGQGRLVAYYMLSLAWESGQTMRIMFLDHLTPPNPGLIFPPLREERKFLESRLHREFQEPYPVVPNSFILTILGLDAIPKPFTCPQQARMLAEMAYESYKKNKSKTAQALQTTPETVTKLLKEKSPQKSKDIVLEFQKSEEDSLAKQYNVSIAKIKEVRKNLFGLSS